ncbi:cupin domain-containing protein [Novosphingobium sp. SG720]|uniref:cupin domain-containing protein n=1 Tax=Novosphingobium sp. SG720 TaxID=2586998 RepID=UPI0017D0AE63|nr:cupin domain-containing protein [Novosphingobium sp. SG720]NKJ43420.1 putative cupin superfamily protein [Novosphingobium sp. SG720]
MRPIPKLALALCLGLALPIPAALADTGAASIAKPAKLASSAVTAALAGSAAHHSSEGGVAVSDLPQLHSADKKFMSGAYAVAGPNHDSFTGEGYPVNEFMVFLSGGVTLTSADGTVLEVKAGDSVSIPKGWIGKWDSTGYQKFYVVYDPEKPVE